VVQNPDYMREKIRLAAAQAQKVEQANALAAGKLVAVDQVTREWVSLTTTVRNAMLALPARLGARVSLTRADLAIVDEEIKSALTALGTPRLPAEPPLDGSELI
jgi:phage terminase Nu1 subunit (DNA packaging protein)